MSRWESFRASNSVCAETVATVAEIHIMDNSFFMVRRSIYESNNVVITFYRLPPPREAPPPEDRYEPPPERDAPEER